MISACSELKFYEIGVAGEFFLKNGYLILKQRRLIGCFNFLFCCFSVHGYSRIIDFVATSNTKFDLYLLMWFFRLQECIGAFN